MVDLPSRLIYCRTPLQALIAAEIQRVVPARDTVLYYPISGSAKHRTYFERLDGIDKAFVDFRTEEPPEILHLLSAYRRVPRAIRGAAFDQYLYSSIGCLVLSLVMRRSPPGAHWASFDDGLFNITPEILDPWIAGDSRSRRLVKRMLGGPSNVALFRQASVHYTIYDEAACLSPAPSVRKILPFAGHGTVNRGKQVRIVLGTPPRFLSPAGQRTYAAILASNDYDLFVPHPAEDSALVVRNLPEAAALEPRLRGLIAEDIAAEIASLGYQPEIVGFASSVVANLAAQYRTVNVDLGSDYGEYNAGLAALGIPTLAVDRLFPGVG